jgi:undecaprenyl-diphosphatase
VAAALIVGGIAMIGVEHGIVKRHARLHPEKPFKSIDDMTYQDAVLVGLAQCLALWPGTSRSMSTILGAQLRGFSDVASAEFSFLLALPTLGAATLYKLLKNHRDLAGMDGGMMLVLVGSAVSFVVAFLAMRWFVRIVTRHGMTPFGLYRIIVGVVFLCLAAWGGLALAP